MFDLAGRRALVTGASGGIGHEIARVLAAAGASVALSGTRVEPLEALAAEIGEQARAVPCNLAEPQEVEELIARAGKALGPIDILVNNAGVTRDGLAMRLGDDAWQTVIDINLTAAFRLCRAALRPMMKARWGRIINISSVVAQTGNPGQVNYAAAKAGLVGLSKALAAEVASRGITVNCVAPGFVRTAMTDKLSDAQQQAILGAVPVGRMGTPGEIAAAVLYLASPEAAYVTGTTLHVNGGMAMI